MPEWTFTLIVDRPVGDRDDEIFEALDGYAFAVGEENGAWVVECAGEYPRYRDLLLGCIATLSLDLGIETLAVQDEGDEVTLQEIADRIGKSREAVAKYSRGELKSATEPFPPPVRNTSWGARWSWSDVSTWLLHNTDWSRRGRRGPPRQCRRERPAPRPPRTSRPRVGQGATPTHSSGGLSPSGGSSAPIEGFASHTAGFGRRHIGCRRVAYVDARGVQWATTTPDPRWASTATSSGNVHASHG
jgi:predicted DNA-binding transcriptional regulator AlpA